MFLEGSLFLRLGLACNNRCYMCAGTWLYQANLSTAQIIRRLCLGREKGLSEVIFSGGEPTVRRDLVQVVSAAKALGYKSVVLQTNARRLSQGGFTKDLIEAGITRFVVSLHGHDAEINDKITGVQGSFSQTLEGINNIKAKSFGEARIVIHSVILPTNYMRIHKLIQLIISLDIPMIKLSHVVPVGRASGIFHSNRGPTMSDTLPYLFSALDQFLFCCQNRPYTAASIGYYPFCLLKGYERYSDEIGAPPTYMIIDEGDFILAELEIEKHALKVKGPNCHLCNFESMCSGLWREYPESFGWDEFIPITEYMPSDVIPSYANQHHSTS